MSNSVSCTSMNDLSHPYATDKLIFRETPSPYGDVYFIIDPGTQRWLIGDSDAMSLLKLCDGKHTPHEIIQSLTKSSNKSFEYFSSLMSELFENQLIFTNQSNYDFESLPIYNKSELTGFHIEITNACNMVCEHCYVSSGKKMENELTFDEIKTAIDMLPSFSGKKIVISGGEPATRKDCGEIIEYCVMKCGHDVDVYTNGRNFPEKLTKKIQEINKLSSNAQVRLQVSLEGATEKTNDQIRGPGSFSDTMKSLKMFQRMNLNRNVILFICITKFNIDEIDEMFRLAERLDVSTLVFSQWQKQGNAGSIPWKTIAPSLEEWTNAGQKILEYKNPNLLVFGNFFGDLNNNEFGRYSLDTRIFPKHVYYYNAFPRITPTGDIYADQLWVDPTWKLGNIKTDTLEECFNKPQFFEQLNLMRDRINHVEDCQKCEWRDLCMCGSPGHTYAEYGHMNEKDLFCESRKYWFDKFVNYQTALTFGNKTEQKSKSD